MIRDEPTDSLEVLESDATEVDPPAEVLVEEISIDGMCGVY